MTSQIYLHGRLQGNPEIASTKKGAPWIRLLLETELHRPDGRSSVQTETVVLPISCFSREAEAARDLTADEPIVVGAHLYGTQFELTGGEIRRGVVIVADALLAPLRKARV
jgi:hypothetical protein